MEHLITILEVAAGVLLVDVGVAAALTFKAKRSLKKREAEYAEFIEKLHSLEEGLVGGEITHPE